MGSNLEFYNEFRAIIDRYDRFEANMVKFGPELIEGCKEIIQLFYPENYDKIKWESKAFVDFAQNSYAGVNLIIDHYLYGYEKGDYLVEWDTEIDASTGCEEMQHKWLSMTPNSKIWNNINNLIRKQYFEVVYYGCYQMYLFKLFKKLIVDFYPELVDLSSEGFRELNMYLAYKAQVLKGAIFYDFEGVDNEI